MQDDLNNMYTVQWKQIRDDLEMACTWIKNMLTDMNLRNKYEPKEQICYNCYEPKEQICYL